MHEDSALGCPATHEGSELHEGLWRAESRAAAMPRQQERGGEGRVTGDTEHEGATLRGAGGVVLGHHAAGAGWVGGFLHYPRCGHWEGSEGSAALREPRCRTAEGLEDFSAIVIRVVPSCAGLRRVVPGCAGLRRVP